MYYIDLIILSNAITPQLEQMTINAINSCEESNDGNCHFNYFVIEQNENVTYYTPHTTTLRFEKRFNYNRFMNHGLRFTTSEYIALCNNDIIFGKNWGSIIVEAMKANNVVSASPQSVTWHQLKPEIEYGYVISGHIAGWCIVVNRSIFDIIGKLDESYEFWYADHLYQKQLIRHDIKHIIVRDSHCEHLGSKTLSNIDKNLHKEYTTNLAKRFWKEFS